MSFDSYQDSEYGGTPLLLFRFYSGARTWLYSNQKSAVTRGSETYAPIAIGMGPTQQSAQEMPNGVEITLPSSAPLAAEFKPFLPPQPIEIDVFVRHRDDPEGEYRTVFLGECGSGNFNDDGTATITCYPLQHKLSRTTPWPVYCTQCNWAVYSHGCGVNRELFKTPGTVSTISDNLIGVPALAVKPDGWFSLGYAVRDLTGEARWIIAHTGSELILVAPFLGLASGESVTVYAGCDGLESTCKTKFDNLPRHAGFPDVPRRNPFQEDVFGTNTGGTPGGGSYGYIRNIKIAN